MHSDFHHRHIIHGFGKDQDSHNAVLCEKFHGDMSNKITIMGGLHYSPHSIFLDDF